MCCFSGPVEHVANTKIFARGAANGRQFLVYEMDFRAKADVAMILPLPVPPKSMEDDVRFLDFSKYESFFVDVEAGFPRKGYKSEGIGAGSFGGSAPPLAVVVVGEFVASFVPTVKDFNRLDERFRLPSDTWLKDLPQYRDWGFAVFKLKAKHRKVHPMGFDFPRRARNRIFFPTVHIHDGKVHEVAEFDHVLYMQLTEAMPRPLGGWRESDDPAAKFLKVEKCHEVVQGQSHVYRRELFGRQKNRDILV